MDLAIAIHMLSSDHPIDSILSILILDARALSRLVMSDLIHTTREGNAMSYHLAKVDHAYSQRTTILDAPLPCLFQAMLINTMGIPFLHFLGINNLFSLRETKRKRGEITLF